jgi:hypothetical protein
MRIGEIVREGERELPQWEPSREAPEPAPAPEKAPEKVAARENAILASTPDRVRLGGDPRGRASRPWPSTCIRA